MDAMSTVDEPERRLEIRGHPDTQGGSPAARISVQDRGIGLHAGQADRLFEAFYTTKPHGMGMGSAISRSIIEAHGGRLWAESNPRAGRDLLLPSSCGRSAGSNVSAPDRFRRRRRPIGPPIDRAPGSLDGIQRPDVERDLSQRTANRPVPRYS